MSGIDSTVLLKDDKLLQSTKSNYYTLDSQGSEWIVVIRFRTRVTEGHVFTGVTRGGDQRGDRPGRHHPGDDTRMKLFFCG